MVQSTLDREPIGFKGIETIEDTGRSSKSQYLDPISETEQAEYTLEIGACRYHVGFGGDSFIAEFTCLATNNPNKHPGQTMSMVKKITQKSLKFALRDIKAFVAAAYGKPFDTITEADCKAVCSSKQPLMGTQVKCIAYDTVSPKGGHFTNYKWSLVRGKS